MKAEKACSEMQERNPGLL